MESVKSVNLCKSLPSRQAGVIQTRYDIVKAHGGELKVETNEGEDLHTSQAGTEMTIQLPIA